ncbi:spermatogenesis-associated serine-rich protein 1-like [Gigantopelta aegis]|uniref:spermatogenesis-associated serine-rich protein 1-like n=1 Tax=Gigantopelta aegis TaxID=1735272 RepID=UPI001B888229|nr:spermatogenesis-associated serine-rich protein 1-like [Gigantopelta aegis]
MLHVTTEVGKPGIKERQKRHFPHIHNTRSTSIPTYKPHGRRYIPHGYGTYVDWKPHPMNIDIEYSVNGPDWSSSLMTCIPQQFDQKYPAAEIWPNNWHAMRPYPYTYKRSDNEWLLDPDLTNIGLRCVFDGTHKATNTSENEITHTMLYGRGRPEPLIDQRNGIDEAAPGDKSYQAVEYSPSFHNLGSTRPMPIFGAHKPTKKPDTFVPLETSMLGNKRETFRQKETVRQTEDDVVQVKKLDEWKPATPLVPAQEDKRW